MRKIAIGNIWYVTPGYIRQFCHPDFHEITLVHYLAMANITMKMISEVHSQQNWF